MFSDCLQGVANISPTMFATQIGKEVAAGLIRNVYFATCDKKIQKVMKSVQNNLLETLLMKQRQFCLNNLFHN